MDSVSSHHNRLKDSTVLKLTGTVTLIAIIVVFVVVVFVICLYLYAKIFWWRVQASGPPARQNPAVSALKKGLEPSVLNSLPVVVFSQEEFSDGLECAVCLCEVVQEEKVRLLPKCNHGFHVDCIDMWFHSHDTCPLCRCAVVAEASSSSMPGSEESVSSVEGGVVLGSLSSSETFSYPTNVLFWGNESHVSSGSAGSDGGEGGSHQCGQGLACPAGSSSSVSRPEGMLVIDIPSRMSENLSSPLSSRLGEEEGKSPMTTRLRSLKRILSREKRSNPCSPSSGDIEQARRGDS